MSIFKTKGFDSIIGKNMFVRGDLMVPPDHVLVVDGIVSGNSLLMTDPAVASKATVIVNGTVDATGTVAVCNITVCGALSAKEVRAERTLAVKAGCQLRAETIYYRELVVEPGAVILGQMKHLDHVAEGEQV